MNQLLQPLGQAVVSASPLMEVPALPTEEIVENLE